MRFGSYGLPPAMKAHFSGLPGVVGGIIFAFQLVAIVQTLLIRFDGEFLPRD